ncbi:MAG: AMP-binding protein, partial [Bdellovibrionales bacterium]|nr:AMP-binding protein [Bdellovibrionales bacterium]
MEKIWLKHYPKDVAQTIDINTYSSIVDLFTEAVQRFKHKPCFTNMGMTYTYAEVDTMSDYFASYLINHLRLKKGDRIAIQMPNLLQYPVAMFGALKAGLIIVNTNPLYTDREMEHQFKDADCKAIVILENFAHLLQKILPHTDLQHVIITSVGDLLPFPKNYVVNAAVKYVKKMVPKYDLPLATRFNDAIEIGKKQSFDPVRSTIDEVAFLQYTGGTTGVAKGAMLTHGNLLANMLQTFEWFKPMLVKGDEVALTPLPLYHIFSLTVNCLTLMAYGAHNILVTNPRDLPDLIKTMKKYRPSVMSGVNTLFNALLNNKDFQAMDLSFLKISVAGGMALQEAVAKRWIETTKSPLVEGYGLTESSPIVCCNPIDGRDKRGTIGLPFPSTDVKLVDDNGNEVAHGTPGELYVKGPQVMKGYWQRPEETAKTMDDGWLKTGDIATVDEQGYFKIVDRKKDMIIVSGFNVYPNEVEDVFASHPAVLEVAAIGVPDDRSGEAVKIFVVKKAETTSQDLIEFSKKKLTGYKVPKHVE